MRFPYLHPGPSLHLCSMTTCVARTTSIREDPPHVESAPDGKTLGHAFARHARSPEGAGTGSSGAGVEFPGTIGFARGSAMELARESGTERRLKAGQAARSSLRGGHRLS